MRLFNASSVIRILLSVPDLPPLAMAAYAAYQRAPAGLIIDGRRSSHRGLTPSVNVIRMGGLR